MKWQSMAKTFRGDARRRFIQQLCLQLGISVRTLEKKTCEAELAEWWAYFRLKPFEDVERR